MGASTGYLGDRYSALDEVITGDAVDVIIGDPAEITLAGPSSRLTDTGRNRVRRPAADPHVAAIAERGIKVVTNAAGFDPTAKARVLRTAVAERGVAIRVARVTGDDVSGWISELAGPHVARPGAVTDE
jgi:hypothetical protein